MTVNKTMNMAERGKTAPPTRPGHLSIRKQRIERWVYKGRSVSMSSKAIGSSTALGTSLIQKRAESSLFQTERQLNMHLFQLGEKRDKFTERVNFEQKLFANKQALRHKSNQEILRTLDFVRKSCKYSAKDDNQEEFFDPTILFDGTRSRSLATDPEIHHHDKKEHTEPFDNDDDDDDENSKRQVQFHVNTKRGSQSAHISRKSRSSTDNQRATSTHGIRTINSAPPVTTNDHKKQSIKVSKESKRPSSRIFVSKNSLQELRRYPERFLSKTNRYLPILRQHAIENELATRKRRIQASSDGLDLAYDDAKSFLSEETEPGKSTAESHIPVWDSQIRRTNKLRAPNKINLMDTGTDDTISEYQILVSRLRDHEYNHLQSLIRSNSMEHILEPFSSKKQLANNRRESKDFNEVLHSIDSLNCSTKSNRQKQKKINIEKNLSKLGILIL